MYSWARLVDGIAPTVGLISRRQPPNLSKPAQAAVELGSAALQLANLLPPIDTQSGAPKFSVAQRIEGFTGPESSISIIAFARAIRSFASALICGRIKPKPNRKQAAPEGYKFSLSLSPHLLPLITHTHSTHRPKLVSVLWVGHTTNEGLDCN